MKPREFGRFNPRTRISNLGRYDTIHSRHCRSDLLGRSLSGRLTVLDIVPRRFVSSQLGALWGVLCHKAGTGERLDAKEIVRRRKEINSLTC